MIGMAASVGQGIFGAMGAMQQGEAQGQMYGYQAAVARNNAIIAKQNADYSLATGEQKAMISGMKSRQEIGSAIARMGASGVAVGQGSSKDVLESAGKIAMMDQSIIRNNAAREAYGYEVAASGAMAQAGAYEAAGANARQAGGINALSSILGSASSVSSKWLSASSTGTFSSAPWGG